MCAEFAGVAHSPLLLALYVCGSDCAKAKNVFSQYPGLKSYKVVELDERDDGDAMQDALGKVRS